MRVMVLVKATAESENESSPAEWREEMFEKMGKYNEELVKAGIMLEADGLKPTRFAKRIHFDGTQRTVIDGPFAETKELVAGFWLWQVKSREEAIEWLKRAPFEDTEVEIRQVFETADFAPSDPTGELRKREDDLRKKVEAQRR